jgi:hypothetical protein
MIIKIKIMRLVIITLLMLIIEGCIIKKYNVGLICELNFQAKWKDPRLIYSIQNIKHVFYRNGLVLATVEHGPGIKKIDTFYIKKNKIYIKKNNNKILYFDKNAFTYNHKHIGIAILDTNRCKKDEFRDIKKIETDSFTTYIMEHNYKCFNIDSRDTVYYNPFFGAYKIISFDSNEVMITNIYNCDCIKKLQKRFKEIK